MQKKLTSAEYKEAARLNAIIQPVIESTQTAISQLQFEKKGLGDKLKKIRTELESVWTMQENIVTEGKKMYENRPERLICKVAHHMHSIPGKINLEKKQLQQKADAREYKAKELRQKGFGESEINRILPEISQEDKDEASKKITVLEHEQKQFQAFISDAPVFNTELLKGTEFHTNEQAENS